MSGTRSQDSSALSQPEHSGHSRKIRTKIQFQNPLTRIDDSVKQIKTPKHSTMASDMRYKGIQNTQDSHMSPRQFERPEHSNLDSHNKHSRSTSNKIGYSNIGLFENKLRYHTAHLTKTNGESLTSGTGNPVDRNKVNTHLHKSTDPFYEHINPQETIKKELHMIHLLTPVRKKVI